VQHKVPVFFLLLIFLVPQTSAFDLQEVHIRIDRAGDAVITARFEETPAEYLGIRAAGVAGIALLQDQIRSGPTGGVTVLCSDYGVAVLRVRQFAAVNGDRFETPFIDLSPGKDGSSTGSGTSRSLNPRVTLVFPDGYSHRQDADGTIRPVSHTLGPQQAADPEPSEGCRTRKDLPSSPYIPDELAPAASVAAGITLTGIGLTAVGSWISLWLGHLVTFLQNAVGGVVANKLAAKDKGRHTIDYYTERRAFLGFSVREALVLVAGALLIGILFLFAARDPVDPILIGIYIVMGGLALIVHELGHWYLTRRYGCYTEVRFWGLGAVIMLITSWLFGNVFAQPTMTLVRHHQPLDRRSTALIMLAGPLVSVLIALLCLCLVPLGGIFRTAGMIGFMINLLTGVFELLPVPPCDGSEVRSWSTGVWLLIFLPLMGIYLVVTI
jgi:Zn-dependent protease